MKLNKLCKIEKACAKPGNARFILETPYLSNLNGKPVMVATDGRMLACVPCEAEATEQGYVPVQSLQEARKLPIGDIKISKKESGSADYILENGAIQPFKVDGTFPNWQQVVPKERKNVVAIALDVKLLHALADAMGTEGVILEIADASQAIMVRPSHTSGCESAEPLAFGVLMPIRIE